MLLWKYQTARAFNNNSAIINFAYDDLENQYFDFEWLLSRATLTIKNRSRQLPGDSVSLYIVCWERQCSTLHSKVSYFAELERSSTARNNMKIGVSILLLRNLNISSGHCNAARYTVVAACATLRTASQLRSTSNDDILFISRITIQASGSHLPPTLKRVNDQHWRWRSTRVKDNLVNSTVLFRKLCVAASSVGYSNLKLCMHGPVAAELNRYTRNEAL